MGHTPEQKHALTVKRIEIENRRRIVAANLLAGATYREIAESLNVSPSTVASDVKAIIRQWQDHYADTANKFLHIQYRRLDVLLNAIWDTASKGSLPQIDRVLSIIDRQNTLMGLTRLPTVELSQPINIQLVEVHRDDSPLVLGAGD